MDAVVSILNAVEPELWNLLGVLVTTLLIMGLRAAGVTVNANLEAQLDLASKKGIQLAREENARRVKANLPKMTGPEQLDFAKAYALGELNKHRSTIASLLLGWVFSSFKKPSAADVVTNIHVNLESMGEGSTVK